MMSHMSQGMFASPSQVVIHTPSSRSSRSNKPSGVMIGQLMVKDASGSVVQTWEIKHAKSTLGSSEACTLRCNLPGIAPIHALIVSGSRQTFVRSLAGTLAQDGFPANELLLTEQRSYFDLAGYRFELSRVDAQAVEVERQQAQRMRFALSRPLSLSSVNEPPKSTSSDVETNVNAPWVANIIREAIGPLEAQIDSLLLPLAELQSQTIQAQLKAASEASEQAKQAEQQRLVAWEQERLADRQRLQSLEQQIHTTLQVQQEQQAKKLEADAERRSRESEIVTMVAEQSATMEILNERLGDVNNQLSAIERIVAQDSQQNAASNTQVTQIVAVQQTAIEQLQNGMVSVTESIKQLQERQQAVQSENLSWKNEVQLQLQQLTEAVSDFSEIARGAQHQPELLEAIDLLKKTHEESQNEISRWQSSVQSQLTVLNEKIAEASSDQNKAVPESLASAIAEIQFKHSQSLEELQAWKAELRLEIQTILQTAAQASVSQPQQHATAEQVTAQNVTAQNVSVEQVWAHQALSERELLPQSAPQPSDQQLSDQLLSDQQLSDHQLPNYFESHSPEPEILSDDQISSWANFNQENFSQENFSQETFEGARFQQPSYLDQVDSQPDYLATQQVDPTFFQPQSSARSIEPIYEPKFEPNYETAHALADDQFNELAAESAANFATPDNGLGISGLWLQSEAQPDQFHSLDGADSNSATTNSASLEAEPVFGIDQSSSQEQGGVQLPSWWTNSDDTPQAAHSEEASEQGFDLLKYSTPSPASQDSQETTQRSESISSEEIPESVRDSIGWDTLSKFVQREQERESTQWNPESLQKDQPQNVFLQHPVNDQESHERAAQPDDLIPRQLTPEFYHAKAESLDDVDQHAHSHSSAAAESRLDAFIRSASLSPQSSPEAAPIEPTATTHSPAPSAVNSPAKSSASIHHHSEEEESVEAYMKNLLARMRGSNSEAADQAKAEESATAASSAPAVPPSPYELRNMLRAEQAQAALSEPMDLDTYVPMTSAPEKTRNMSAFRELANTNARSAIHKSTRRKTLSGSLMKFAISAIALTVAAALFAINGVAINIALIATMAALFVAVIWGYDGLKSLKPLLQNSLVLQPTAASDAEIDEDEDEEDRP